VNIHLDTETVRNARDLGLNILKIAQNELDNAIGQLKGENSEINSGPAGIRTPDPRLSTAE